jgi:hypothetical protein
MLVGDYKKYKRPFPHRSTVTSQVTKGDAPCLQLEFLPNSVFANEESDLANAAMQSTTRVANGAPAVPRG